MINNEASNMKNRIEWNKIGMKHSKTGKLQISSNS